MSNIYDLFGHYFSEHNLHLTKFMQIQSFPDYKLFVAHDPVDSLVYLIYVHFKRYSFFKSLQSFKDKYANIYLQTQHPSFGLFIPVHMSEFLDGSTITVYKANRAKVKSVSCVNNKMDKSVALLVLELAISLYSKNYYCTNWEPLFVNKSLICFINVDAILKYPEYVHTLSSPCVRVSELQPSTGKRGRKRKCMTYEPTFCNVSSIKQLRDVYNAEHRRCFMQKVFQCMQNLLCGRNACSSFCLTPFLNKGSNLHEEVCKMYQDDILNSFSKVFDSVKEND